MNELSFERLFSMGAFEGLRILRQHNLAMPGMDLLTTIDLALKLHPEASGLDFAGAMVLHKMVDADAALDGHDFYRCCISSLILTRGNTWARAITLGRDRLVRLLGRDEAQCFRAAHLLESPPPSDVVSWWDGVSSRIRTDINAGKLERGRLAERLSIEHEIARLSALGIARSPHWIAIDDNTAGYDILSFDAGEFEPVNRLIEVKSTVLSPLRFIITRNEWDKALKFGSAYHFHIWDTAANPPRLFERTMLQIAPHIPSDNEKGKWATAEIPLGSD